MNLTNEEIRIKVAESLGVHTKHCRGWTMTHTSFRHGSGTWKHFTDEAAAIEWNRLFPFEEFKTETYTQVNLLPNYTESLDACAEFEKTLTDEEQQEYFYQLNEEVGLVSPRSPAWLLEWSVFKLITATARQRCLAYLKTKGLIS